MLRVIDGTRKPDSVSPVLKVIIAEPNGPHDWRYQRILDAGTKAAFGVLLTVDARSVDVIVSGDDFGPAKIPEHLIAVIPVEP